MKTLDAEAIIAAGRGIQTPFILLVRKDGESKALVVRKVLRLLPGKRIVAVAQLDDEQVLVKAYVGRSAGRYAKRERRGVGLIVEAGVQTPALKWTGRFADGKGEALVFEYLADAVSLHDRWRHADREEEKIDVMTRAMVTIAKLHHQGVVQNDIHLANFLLSSGRLFMIDGGDIARRSEPPLPESASLKNLGMFFAQFYPRYDHFALAVLPAYEAARGWQEDLSRPARLAKEIYLNRERRKRTCINKAYRDCTRFRCVTSFQRYEVCERSFCTPAMEALLADPDQAIRNGVLIKDGNASTVAIVELDGRSLVIKRYNFKSTWHRVRRTVRPSRAWTSWGNACRMEFLGIPSVRPIAMIEARFGPLRSTAYFITEYVEGQDALVCIRNLTKINGEPEALTSILRDLSYSRISHGDLKATNFVMSNAGPIILDLDAMREHRTKEGFKRAFQRDLNRFMQNWQDRPELADRFAGLISNLSR